MKYLYAISFVFLSFFADSQGWMWAKHFKGTGQNLPVSSVNDQQGNSYIYGNFNGTVSQDSLTLVTAGLQDIFISKYDKNGQILWLKAITGTATESAVSIVLSNDGNYFYVSGTTNGLSNFDGNSVTSAGGLDVFLAKYSVNGTLIWVHNSVSGAGNQGNGNIIVDASGNIAQLGTFTTVATFYGGFTLNDASGIRQNFFAKYDPDGNLLWAKQIQDDNATTFAKTITTGSNEYLISGNYQGNLLLDIGTITSSGLNDGFLYKTDINGNGIYVRKISGNGDDIIWKHTSDSNNNQYLTGYFTSSKLRIDSTDTDTSKNVLTNISSGTNDIFILKYNSSGILQWAKSVGTNSNDYSYNIDATNNNILLTGSFSGLINFDSYSLTNIGATDAFVAECNSSGQFTNAVRAAGKADDYGKTIEYSSTGRNFIASGEFYSDTLTVGSNQFVNSSTLRDAYVVRFGCFDSVNFQVTPVTCIDGMGIPLVDDGAITVTPSEGSAPYTYLWSNGATTSTITNLGLGTFYVTVSGSNGCSLTESAVVSYKPLLNATITNIQNVVCNGAATGSVTVTASLGTPPYSYIWSEGSTTSVISNIFAGNYSVTVTDQCGTEVVKTALVTEPPVLTGPIAGTNPDCNGASTGSANLTPGGGTPPYTFMWSNGATSEDLNGIAAGTYIVTITDFEGCTLTNSTVLTDPTAVLASITSRTYVSCNGGSDGSATVTASGGTAPYSYLWDDPAPSQTTPVCSGLTAGTWSVTVTDANGCVDRTSVIITEPTLLTSSITSQTNVSCNGGSDGSATVTAAGGTSPYSYIWNDPAPEQTTPVCTALTAGTWSVTVTDNMGCTSLTNVIITEPAILTSSITSQTNVACNGGATGSATVTAGGGTPGYTYLWNDPSSQTTPTCNSLTSGVWTVTVTDANLCTAAATVTITQPAILTSSITSQTNITCNNGSNGSATVTAGGGTPGYTYLWNDPAPAQTTATCTALSAGIWTVTVTDANLCTATSSVTITQPVNVIASISSQTNVSCFGGSNGSATATFTGGSFPTTYVWNDPAPVQTTATCSNLTAGVWSVTVTRTGGCGVATVTITEPPLLTATITSFTNVSCRNGSDGSATVTASGGTPGYTYNWSPNGYTGDGTPTYSNLIARNYTVTVTCVGGCTASTSILITQPTRINITPAITCSNASPNCSGTITANVTGGTPPYTYLWNDINSQTTQMAVGL